MLITFIVTAAVLAGIYLVINVFKKKAVGPDYDFKTGAQKSILIFAHMLSVVSFSVIASEAVICLLWENKLALWGLFGVFLLCAILALVLICGLYFTYEAISGDVVYVHRFFKIKKIKISDIRRIENIGLITVFCDKNNKCLFLVDSITPGLAEFVRRIGEKKSDEPSGESQAEALAEEEAVLAEMGRRYRESYNRRKKKFIIAFSVVGTAVLSALLLIFFFLEASTGFIAIMGLLGALALAVNNFSMLSGMKKELGLNDVSLGNKHKFENKKVKGASKYKFKRITAVCISGMFLGIVLLLPLLLISGEKQDYDDFTQITGKLEYYREHTGRNSYIALGFYDMETEYRLSSRYLNEFDYSFFDEVKKGDTVTVLIDNDKNREFSLRGIDRKRWNHFYYLAADGNEYFTYNDYVISRERNDRIGFIISMVGIAIFAASSVALVSAYFVCKKNEKAEDIVICK